MKKILIITGDPNSINSEIIYKSWKNLKTSVKKKIYFISNYDLMRAQFQKLNYSLKLINVNNIDEESNNINLKIININLNFKNPFKVNNKSAGKFIKECLNYSHKLALKGNITGIINCAISKKLLSKKNIGVTEYLATKCNITDDSEVMLITNNNFSVSPITTHINLKQVSKNIKSKKIIKKIKTIQKYFGKFLRRKPKIAILGLNPHNSEFRKNSEEIRTILPAIKKLKKLGINVKGPYAADTIFTNGHEKFDVIVGMYHDQVLSPFKALFKFNAINVTLGLKYLRTSPDHGVAIDLIGKNKADHSSLVSCIDFIKNFG